MYSQGRKFFFCSLINKLATRKKAINVQDNTSILLLVIGMVLFIVFLAILNEYKKTNLALCRERDYYRALSTVDSLTGVGNKRSLDVRLEEEIDRSIRSGDPLCFALLDVDKFKQVNAAIGHAEANIVLQTLSGNIKTSIRRSDHVYRFGGDEFAIVMPNTDPSKATEVINRIFELVRNDLFLRENSISFSVGITVFPSSAFNSDNFRQDHLLIASDIVSQASNALINQAKTGNGIAVYSDIQV